MAIRPAADPYQKTPHSKPPFTLADIRRAIPPRCFRRSLLRSFFHLFTDLALILLLHHLAATHFHLIPVPLTYALWPAFWAAQGCFLVGWWVLAHECGHHAFSDYACLDDALGFLIHSSLLVPYFSWKLSHRLHHAHINSLDKDESFVPKQRNQLPWWHRSLCNPPGRLLLILASALAGWPLYLLCNITGRSYHRLASHFDPFSPMYEERDRVQIYASDAGVIAAAYGLYRVAMAKGVEWLVCFYAAPLVVVHALVVLIIYLHHTHPSLPRYGGGEWEWEWLKGALGTVDRDYGVLNHVFHHIADTHVLHHLLPSLPHYHAVEATAAIRPVLGEYYRCDGTPILKSLWREVRECVYIEPAPQSNGLFWFTSKGLS